MTPSQRSALVAGAAQDDLEAGERLGDRAVDVLAVVGLRRRQEDVDLLEALRRAQRVVQPALVGDQDRDRDVVGAVDAGQHLVGVGQLRDDVGAHEARRLDAPQPGAHERVDEPHLVVGRDDLRLVLKAVARADLADAHALRKLGHRTLNIYSPPLSEPIAIIGATGALGFGLTLRWGRAGVPIVLGSRDADRAVEAAERARAALPDGPLRGLRERRGGHEGRGRRALRALPQPVRDADQPQGRAARAPARRRRHRPAGGRRQRPRDAHARRLAGLGRPAGPGDGPRRRAGGQRAFTPSAPRRAATSSTRSTRTSSCAATTARTRTASSA